MKLSVNGIETFVGTGGRDFDPSLPVVVFLHGAGMDRSAWALHSRWFAHHGFAVLAPDFPGHGLSQGSPLTSIAAMADEALSVAFIICAAMKVSTGRIVPSAMPSEIMPAKRPDTRLEASTML